MPTAKGTELSQLAPIEPSSGRDRWSGCVKKVGERWQNGGHYHSQVHTGGPGIRIFEERWVGGSLSPWLTKPGPESKGYQQTDLW